MLILPALFLVSCVVGMVCIRFIGPLGFMDIPGGRRTHAEPVPRIGGLAFFLALYTVCTLLGRTVPLGFFQWTALAGIAVVGLVDDRLDLRARWKVLASLAVALALAAHSLVEVTGAMSTIQLLWFEVPYHPLAAFLLFLMLYWGIPQAFNLIDGANGLAIGYGVIVSTVLHFQGVIGPAIPIVLLGLLVLNWPIPRLFLGDCGALALGLLFAMLAHQAWSTTQPNAILWLFAYPTVDVTMVVCIRALSGQSLVHGDRNHLHHQLADRLGRLAFLAVPILWVLAGLCASMPLLPPVWRFLPWTGLGVFLALAFLFLAMSLKKGTPNFNTQV